MTQIVLKPEPISEKNFARYGTILDKVKADSMTINDGFATRYDKLAVADISEGTAQIAIFSATKRPYPMQVDMMERHPLGTQAFYPIQPHGWYAIVCDGEKPTAENLKAFAMAGDIGVQYHRNIWHYPLLISAETQDFLVMDYCGDKGKENLELYDFISGGNFAVFSPA